MTDKKAKRLVWILFGGCLGLAVLCIGTAIYLVMTYRGKLMEGSHIPDITEIIFFIGMFFGVLAFGHLLPILMKQIKRERKGI